MLPLPLVQAAALNTETTMLQQVYIVRSVLRKLKRKKPPRGLDDIGRTAEKRERSDLNGKD